MNVVTDQDFTLHVGDAVEILRSIPVDTANAVVTSPPYVDARPDVMTLGFEAYMDWCEEWLFSLAFIVKQSGSLMLNLGRIHRDGLEMRWHDDVLDRAALAGWKLLDTIVWHKVNGGGGRSTPYLIDRHEYVFWLVRSPEFAYRGFDEARVPYSEATIGRYNRKWSGVHATVKGVDGVTQDGRTLHPDGAKAGSVFTSSVGATKGIDHPTPMDVDLAEHLVKLSCPRGGVVLDPFLGSGTTAWAARKLGRRSIGIELDQGYADEAAARMAQQALV